MFCTHAFIWTISCQWISGPTFTLSLENDLYVLSNFNEMTCLKIQPYSNKIMTKKYQNRIHWNRHSCLNTSNLYFSQNNTRWDLVNLLNEHITSTVSLGRAWYYPFQIICTTNQDWDILSYVWTSKNSTRSDPDNLLNEHVTATVSWDQTW